MQSSVIKEGINLNATQYNATINDDKNFWEWILAGILSPSDSTTENPKPETPEGCLPCSKWFYWILPFRDKNYSFLVKISLKIFLCFKIYYVFYSIIFKVLLYLSKKFIF